MMSPNRLSLIGITLVGGLLGGAVMHGCSEEKKYRVLTFFFDGVPAPGAPSMEEAARAVSTRGGKPAIRTGPPPGEQVYNVVAHRQFKCGSCHLMTSGMSLKKGRTDLCVTCHEQTHREHRYVHGPVAVSQCGACHSAHRTKYPGATWNEQPALCVGCHTEPNLMERPPHKDTESQKCTACHDPHGTENRFLLRAGNTAATQPTTKPAKNR